MFWPDSHYVSVSNARQIHSLSWCVVAEGAQYKMAPHQLLRAVNKHNNQLNTNREQNNHELMFWNKYQKYDFAKMLQKGRNYNVLGMLININPESCSSSILTVSTTQFIESSPQKVILYAVALCACCLIALHFFSTFWSYKFVFCPLC